MGVCHDFDSARLSIPYSLHRLSQVRETVRQHFNDIRLQKVSHIDLRLE